MMKMDGKMKMLSRILAGISNLFSRRKNRESFQSFLFHETICNPSLNLDDALNLYIKEYNLCVRSHLDEPEVISVIRTKLQIMEEMLSLEPEFNNQSQLTEYVMSLRRGVDAFNALTPECLKRMKEKAS